MYRTLYPSEEMVGTSDIERAVDSRSSKADVKDNFLTIANEMNEVETFLSAARSYVNTSKNVLEHLKRYLCFAEADILSAAECITESEMRLQRMHLELHSLFQNIFYQDLGHCNPYVSNERKTRSTQTSSMPGHVLDTVRRYAKDKSINLINYTATCDEYDGATFIILHPNSILSAKLLSQKRDSLDSNIYYQQNILEPSTSASDNEANRNYTTLKDSKNLREKFEGVLFNNPQWEASGQQQPNVHTESLEKKRAYNSKSTSCEIHQQEKKDSSLPVNELRQHSFQTAACNICPNLTESRSETSFSYQHNQGKCCSVINFPVKSRLPSEDISDFNPILLISKNAKHFAQIGSKRNSASDLISTGFTEFPESEKTNSNKVSGRQVDVTQTEGTHITHSRNPVKKGEMAKDINGNIKLFATQTDGDLTKASISSDFISNKDNESGSGSTSQASSSRETILTFPLQSRRTTNMSSETRFKFFQTGAKKDTFCNRRAISLPTDFTEKLFVADKVRTDKCDRRKNDVLTSKRFSLDIPLEAAIALNDENASNSSKNSTLNVASNNISKTSVPSNSNTEYINFKNRSCISCHNDNVLTSTNNTLRSLTIHGKPYSSSQKEVPNTQSSKFSKEIADIKRSDSRNSMDNHTSPEENTNRSRKENVCGSEQEQLDSKMQFFVGGAIPRGNNSRKLTKELFEQEGSKNRLLVGEYSDCSVSEIIASDNPSVKAELECSDTSSELKEPDYGSKYKCASDMNCVNISSETGESERFQNVSSIVHSDSSTAANHSRLSQTARSSVHPFGDHCFGVSHSPGEEAGLLAEKSLNVNESSTNTGCFLENNFENLRPYSCCPLNRNASLRISFFPLVSSFRDSPTPMEISSSSVENSP